MISRIDEFNSAIQSMTCRTYTTKALIIKLIQMANGQTQLDFAQLKCIQSSQNLYVNSRIYRAISV